MPKGHVTESIFSGTGWVIALAEVVAVEKDRRPEYAECLSVHTTATRWDFKNDDWGNALYLQGDEAQAFLRAWCRYRSELEHGTLMEPMR